MKSRWLSLAIALVVLAITIAFVQLSGHRVIGWVGIVLGAILGLQMANRSNRTTGSKDEPSPESDR